MSNAEGPGACDLTTRLPPEILAEIFLTSLVNGEDSDSDILSWEAPWLLSDVCGRWKAIALSTPELWCSLLPIRRQPLAHLRCPGLGLCTYREVQSTTLEVACLFRVVA
ncbi:hypothetical protein B0H16DRAFT_1496688 [Mycena metata]|uniref:F-box domain-containing protein n=1 Tax=Mycena metata TaxID=1033252 RepID=A0AAD7NZ17_9AGAR|nr:hypothetical protein B0H16DRAFT_1496688 [Mycena metata]